MCNHGLRHGQKVGELVAFTKHPEFVMLCKNGQAVVRQKKESSGTFFRPQSFGGPFGSPDNGREGYLLQYFDGKQWRTYDDRASDGDIVNQLYRMDWKLPAQPLDD